MVARRHGLLVLSVLLALTLLLALAVAGPARSAATTYPHACADAGPPRFADVDHGGIHTPGIACIVHHDVTRGVGGNRYAPAGTVTRAQMASFVVRTVEAAGGDLPAAADQGFADVAGNTHEDAINRLAAAGIVAGRTATTYAPDLPVRRDQMATFLVRAHDRVADVPLPPRPPPFTDVAGNTHEAAIGKVAGGGLAAGTTSTRFSPARAVRRDQMATFLARLLDRLAAPQGRTTIDRPDEHAGYALQPMYVVPSDGEDRGLDVDGSIERSVAFFNDWLAEQTGGARLRVDTFGNAPDVVFHRLGRTEADLATTGIFLRDELEQELHAAGFDKPATIYAVYYDGTTTVDACGGAAWPPALVGNVVAQYLQQCGAPVGQPEIDPYNDLAMLHEIVHALGIVPDTDVGGVACAPNQRLGGHVGDDPRDLMYAGDQPWDIADLRLDVGADDYAYTPLRPGCPNLRFSAFLEPLPDPAQAPPGW